MRQHSRSSADRRPKIENFSLSGEYGASRGPGRGFARSERRFGERFAQHRSLGSPRLYFVAIQARSVIMRQGCFLGARRSLAVAPITAVALVAVAVATANGAQATLDGESFKAQSQ